MIIFSNTKAAITLKLDILESLYGSLRSKLPVEIENLISKILAKNFRDSLGNMVSSFPREGNIEFFANTRMIGLLLDATLNAVIYHQKTKKVNQIKSESFLEVAYFFLKDISSDRPPPIRIDYSRIAITMHQLSFHDKFTHDAIRTSEKLCSLLASNFYGAQIVNKVGDSFILSLRQFSYTLLQCLELLSSLYAPKTSPKDVFALEIESTYQKARSRVYCGSTEMLYNFMLITKAIKSLIYHKINDDDSNIHRIAALNKLLYGFDNNHNYENEELFEIYLYWMGRINEIDEMQPAVADVAHRAAVSSSFATTSNNKATSKKRKRSNTDSSTTSFYNASVSSQSNSPPNASNTSKRTNCSP